jgi:hypothetical protein
MNTRPLANKLHINNIEDASDDANIASKTLRRPSPLLMNFTNKYFISYEFKIIKIPTKSYTFL